MGPGRCILDVHRVRDFGHAGVGHHGADTVNSKGVIAAGVVVVAFLGCVLALGGVFVSAKIANDSSIARDTGRIAAALESLTLRETVERRSRDISLELAGAQ